MNCTNILQKKRWESDGEDEEDGMPYPNTVRLPQRMPMTRKNGSHIKTTEPPMLGVIVTPAMSPKCVVSLGWVVTGHISL